MQANKATPIRRISPSRSFSVNEGLVDIRPPYATIAAMSPSLIFGIALGIAVVVGTFWFLVRQQFKSLSLEALKEFMTLAQERLSSQTQLGSQEMESKKKLIDGTLESMEKKLGKVEDLMKTLEKDRENKFGELTNQLLTTKQETENLRRTAEELRNALTNSATRGQWGEKMADDVLRIAGFIEGFNYLKNTALSETPNRPDYTFLLPHNLKLNMDVKFPLSNYARYTNAKSEQEQQRAKAQFLKDVRMRVKEVTTRDYINPAEHTLDYVLIFIPNEQVYAFMHQEDPSLTDEALKHNVVLCSPLTLFAHLCVIRQAIDSFTMEKTAGEMLAVIGTFKVQWQKFKEHMGKVSERVDALQRDYTALETTRVKLLDKPLEKLDDLRIQGVEEHAEQAKQRALEVPAVYETV